jgi:hypothetical protein
MLTRRFTNRLLGRASLAILMVSGIESVCQNQGWLIPAQQQVELFGVRYCCRPYRTLPDPDLGFSMAPNQRKVIRTPDYTYHFETDASGFPNRDPWPRDPTLVLLGDSMVLGTGVGLDASFAQLLVGQLPGHTIVNLGIAAAGPERQASVYRRFSGGWHPDLVLSGLYLASDVENDLHFLSWRRDGQGTDYDTYRIQLARAMHSRTRLDRFLDRSVVFNWPIDVLLGWVDGGGNAKRRFRSADGAEMLFGRNGHEFVLAPALPDDPRLDIFSSSVDHLREVVEQSGARLVLVLIPSKSELFAVDASLTTLNLASRLKERLRATGLPVIDLYPVLQQRGIMRAPYFRLDGHLNEYGNQIVADELAAWVGRGLVAAR